MSPLLMAVKRGNYPIARLLLEGRPQLEAMAIVDDLCGKIMFASVRDEWAQSRPFCSLGLASSSRADGSL